MMKKVLLLLSFLTAFFFSQAQSDWRSDVAGVDQTSKIATYTGGSKIIYVKDTATGGYFFLYQGASPTNGVDILAGANGSKWRRVREKTLSNIGSGYDLAKTGTFTIKRINGDVAGFIKADSTFIANSITIYFDSVRLAKYNSDHPISIKLENTGPLKAIADSLLFVTDSSYLVKDVIISNDSVYQIIRGVKTFKGKFIGQAGVATPRNYIDLSKAPYNMTAGMTASLACQNAIDSLHFTYGGGTIFLPFAYNWDRPNGAVQKGVRLRSNITIKGVGQKLTLIGNAPWFTADFGSDSLGTTITADVTDSTTRNFTVASSSGFNLYDTVYLRLGTAPYDAGEPFVFGWFRIVGIPDGTHLTLDKPCGGFLTVSGTSTLNRRIIRVKKRTENVLIEDLWLYTTTALGGLPEAGVYIQGGKNITVNRVKGTNVGPGLVVFQFGENLVLKNSVLDSCDTQGNANWGRGATINECVNCQLLNNQFDRWKQTAIVNEANNPGFVIRDNVINNNYDNTLRTAIINLGSGDTYLENTRFGGYQTQLFDQTFKQGIMFMKDIVFDKGTPINYYDDQGVYTQGFLNNGGRKYYKRKSYEFRFLLPVNNTYSFDSLPKGLMVKARISVDDTTGITNFNFRRDNSFTNNTPDFHSSLRSKTSIDIDPLIGGVFKIGTNLASSNMNYTNDKSFTVTTNATTTGKKWCSVYLEYLEENVGPYNMANSRITDIDLRGVYP